MTIDLEPAPSQDQHPHVFCKSPFCPNEVAEKGQWCEVCQKNRDKLCKEAVDAERVRRERGS